MPRQVLPTNFQDDELNESMNGVRRYKITREDGTTEFATIEDVSDYDKIGSDFGAEQINATNKAVNESSDAIEQLQDDLGEDMTYEEMLAFLSGSEGV